MKNSLILGIAATAAICCAGTARAADLSWSVGIGGPHVGAVIFGGPSYHRAQVYAVPVRYDRRVQRRDHAPAPLAYAPVPVYAPVVYRRAVPVVHGPVYHRGPVAHHRYVARSHGPVWRHLHHPHGRHGPHRR